MGWKCCAGHRRDQNHTDSATVSILMANTSHITDLGLVDGSSSSGEQSPPTQQFQTPSTNKLWTETSLVGMRRSVSPAHGADSAAEDANVKCALLVRANLLQGQRLDRRRPTECTRRRREGPAVWPLHSPLKASWSSASLAYTFQILFPRMSFNPGQLFRTPPHPSSQHRWGRAIFGRFGYHVPLDGYTTLYTHRMHLYNSKVRSGPCIQCEPYARCCPLNQCAYWPLTPQVKLQRHSVVLDGWFKV